LNLVAAAALALVFIVSGLVPIPRTFLCLAAGTVFGLPAVPIILPSTTLGGVIGFLLARYLFSGWLWREVDRRPRLRATMDAIDSESWRIVGLLRFGSPVPTMVQNYLFGLTRIGLLPFTAATFVFTIPQVCLYTYLGAAGRVALLDDTSSTLSRALVGIGALTLATTLILVTRKASVALRRNRSRLHC
jgi:uncharacterized membrane protein YdjX (TVP38/TMEM64 family)